jgi:glycosyltransferase involved in cell wall biosynthesis
MTVTALNVSVVICTRNRGDSIVPTLETVLTNTYPDFEVIVIDQSTNQDTEEAISPFLIDPRLQYIRSTTCGAGRARNIGMSYAKGEIVAFTDDDCTVPMNWLDVITRVFETYSQVNMLFCNVDPAPHNASVGFIPAYHRQDSQLVRTMWEKCHARGIGASMAVRREPILAIGGFDESLGPGTPFSACEEGDLAVRVLLNAGWVYETDQTAVVHYGFRTWQEGKELTRRDWFGIGAAYAKPIKCGHWSVATVLLYEGLVMGLWNPVSKIFQFKKPQGFKRFLYLWSGFIQGLKTPVDRQHIMYKPAEPGIEPEIVDDLVVASHS